MISEDPRSEFHIQFLESIEDCIRKEFHCGDLVAARATVEINGRLAELLEVWNLEVQFRRRVTIFGGADWSNINVGHLFLKEDVDLSAEYTEYKRWLAQNIEENAKAAEYLTFCDWLIRKGKARKDEDVEFYYEEK